MDIKNIKDTHRVTQSNFLVEASYKTPFTLQEMRLLLTMISMIDYRDEELRPYTFSVTEFCEVLGMAEPKYSSIKSAMHKLVGKTIEFVDPDPQVKDVVVTTWFEEARYKTGSGQVVFEFRERLKPYLVGLKRDFITYKLAYVLVLKSVYSIRLYELGKKWSGTKTGKFEYSLDELKTKLGSLKKSYDSYGSFKQKVILPSMVEINEKTDLKMTFEEIKEGRKVVGIRFQAKSKLKEEKEALITDLETRKRAVGQLHKNQEEHGKQDENSTLFKEKEEMLKELERKKERHPAGVPDAEQEKVTNDFMKQFY